MLYNFHIFFPPDPSPSLSSRAKDVIMPARPPVHFFSTQTSVVDLFLGQLDYAEYLRRESEITLYFLYAPWCAQSITARAEIEQVASRLADQVISLFNWVCHKLFLGKSSTVIKFEQYRPVLYMCLILPDLMWIEYIWYVFGLSPILLMMCSADNTKSSTYQYSF